MLRNIRLRWSRPRYFARPLQTFGSAGAGLVISLTRYKHSAPLEPASLFRSHPTNIWLRWSRPRYFAHTLQTFGSAGAGLVISLTRYKHSAPLEPASVFRSHATNIRLRWEPASLFRSHPTNIWLRWSRPRYSHTLQTFGSAGAGLLISPARSNTSPSSGARLFIYLSPYKHLAPL